MMKQDEGSRASMQPACPDCESVAVEVDATATWSVTAQAWVLAGHCDTGWCRDCATDIRHFLWRPVVPIEPRSVA